jgi:hypothetical protein
MPLVLLGAVAACTASLLYNLGVALRALEARQVPAEDPAQLEAVAVADHMPGDEAEVPAGDSSPAQDMARIFR